MNDKPELSNVARVLISRMESHPKDFEMGERFGYLQDSLGVLIGLPTTNPYGGHGRLAYLSEADKAALADAWRAMNYTKFEKEIMDALFQSDAEREEEKKKFAYPLGSQQSLTGTAGRVALQNSMLAQSTGTHAQGLTTWNNAHTGITVQSNGAVNMANTLSLGGETLDSGILKRLKELVK